MSYILDALKRAERERKQGQISVLDEIPAAPVEESRRRLPPLLIPAVGVLVLGGLVYAVVAWLHHGGTPAVAPAPVHPPVALAPPPVLPAPPPQAAPPPAPSATIEDGNKLSSLDDVQAPPAEPTVAADTDQPPSGPPPAAPPGAMAARRPPPSSQPPQQAQQPPPDMPQAADNPPQDAPPPAEDAPADTAPAAPASSDRQLQEMPESFRAGFPALTVDVHAYNSDPQRRFVLIGGKRYHEGDTLAEGPRIAGIVPAGIVFDWQGQRVLYAITH